MINDRKKVTKDGGRWGRGVFFVSLRETIVSPFTPFSNGESICMCVCAELFHFLTVTALRSAKC